MNKLVRSSLTMLAVATATAPALAMDERQLAAAWAVFDIPRIERMLAEAPQRSGDRSGDPAAILFAAAVATARLDTGSAKSLMDRYGTLGDRDAERLRLADDLRFRIAYADRDWAMAAKALAAVAGKSPNPPAGLAQAATLVPALAAAGVPPQRVVAAAAGSIPVGRDAADLLRGEVLVEGRPQEMVLDTGDAISVMAESTARTLGLTVRDAGTAGPQKIRFAVARLEVAGTVLENVPFLVVPDRELRFPGGYSIPAMVGVPVLQALGRVTVDTKNGRLTVAPPDGRRRPPDGNLALDMTNPVVIVEVDGRPLPTLLAIGAKVTTLNARFLALAGPAAANWKSFVRNDVGPGGQRRFEVRYAPRLTLSIGGRGAAMTDVPVSGEPPHAGTPYHGAVGKDFLLRFESYTLDFAAMRVTLGPLRDGGN